MIGDSTYEIRYGQSGSQKLKTVSSNRTLLAYPLYNLETDARYTVEVSQVLVISYGLLMLVSSAAVIILIQGATN